MWNALVSGLLLRASIVMLDGDPAWPDLLEQWRLAEELRPTVMGVSPAYLMACRKAGLAPGRRVRPQLDPGPLRRPAPRSRPRATSTPTSSSGAGRADQRLGRHRRVHGDRRRLARPAGLRRRDLGTVARRRRARVRPRRQRGHRRARRARDLPADAVDAGRASGTTLAASATATRTSTAIPASGVRAIGSASRNAAAAWSPAARTPP